MTYHPIIHWRCIICGIAGEVTHNLADGVDVRWRLVLSDHQTRSPICAEERGDAGIAVAQPCETLTEVH